MITIFFTRHSISTRNLYDSNGEPQLSFVNDTTFRDTALCPDGIERVIQMRGKTREKMGAVDAILTSPLKRCIQTTLLTYQDMKEKSVYPIHVMSLLTEYSYGPDSAGVPMNQLNSDPDVFSYRHFPSLNFNYFMEGYQSQFHPKPLLLNGSGMEWCVLDYRMNPERTRWFFEFLKKHFRGKKIHVVTHSLFIRSVLGYIPDNYETLKVVYDTETEKIKWSKLC